MGESSDEPADGHLDENASEVEIVQDGSDVDEAVEDEPAIEDSADKSLVASVVAAAAITAAKDELIAEDSSFNEDSAEDKPEDKPEGESEDQPAEEIEESAETENKETNETQDLDIDNNNNTGWIPREGSNLTINKLFLDQTDIKEESNDVERFGLACLQCRLSFILAFS